jgi:hypothetical protein
MAKRRNKPDGCGRRNALLDLVLQVVPRRPAFLLRAEEAVPRVAQALSVG